ncbi:NAD(P)-binding protein (plasmid) [Rhizobium sp. T1470]|uniref:NAD(P)-binding protein n=1 Tax=unclassified Rhizobium TaxID=2613769 RepID=UPI001AAFA1EF|nr:NAD(P)-binding protein [Rhizobium sp. T1473]MCA0807402.1 NAD(P)-binding protein [Rhizobium sp. T1473]
MTNEMSFDAVIVGAGVAGALIAKRLSKANLRVLLLEAGPDTTRSFKGYTEHLEHFYAANSKGPESPWPPSVGAPQPDTADLRSNNGYFVQRGPDLYGSSYTRLLGGSTLHWLGVSLRMLPEDFRMRSLHGVGRDWPLDYATLAPYYEQAEHEIGVSADAAEQHYLGLTFSKGYDYPMRRLPPSFSDRVLAAAVDGMEIRLEDQPFGLKVRSYPAPAIRSHANPIGRSAPSIARPAEHWGLAISENAARAIRPVRRSARCRQSTTPAKRWRRRIRNT